MSTYFPRFIQRQLTAGLTPTHRFMQTIYVLQFVCLCNVGFGQQPPTPQLISLFPAGASVDSKTEVSIVEESELELADQLLFSHPGIKATPLERTQNRFFPKGGRIRNRFEVSVSPDVPPGTYEVRASCEYGISNPRRFVISDQAEILESEPNDSPEVATTMEIDSVANGTFESGYDYYRFEASADDSLIVRCISEQIDSRGDPVLSVYDSKMKLIAKNHDTTGRDSLVSFKPPSQGIYFVRVNDLTYCSQGGVGTTPYRLIITRKPWIDFVDPPVLNKEGTTTVRFYGRNLDGQTSSYYRNGIQLEYVESQVTPSEHLGKTKFSELVVTPNRYSVEQFVHKLKTDRGESNPVVLSTSDLELTSEVGQNENKLVRDDSNADKQVVVPAEILDVFDQPGQKLYYRFNAKKGVQYWIEIVSQRMGIGTDPILVLQAITKEKNGDEGFRNVSTIDDFQPLDRPFRLRLETEDPAFLFTAPADGEFRIVIADQFNLPKNHNGPNFFRLRIREPTESVSLIAIPGLEAGQNDNHSRPLKITPCILRNRSAAEIQVFAYRAPGFESDITFNVEGLPQCVTVSPVTMNGNANHATLILRANNLEQYRAKFAEGISNLKIVATSSLDGKKIEFPVAIANVTTNSIGNEPSECRLSDSLFVSVDTTLEAPGKIEITNGGFETAVGGKFELKAKLVPNPKFKGAIQQAFVHGLPREITKSTNTLLENGTEAVYKFDIRQIGPSGTYSPFLRGYIDSNTKRFEKTYEEMTSEQKRLAEVQQEVEREYREATQARTRLTQQMQQQNQLVVLVSGKIRQQENTLKQARGEFKDIESKSKVLVKDITEIQMKISNLKSALGKEIDSDQKKADQKKADQKKAAEKTLADRQMEISALKKLLEVNQTKQESTGVKLKEQTRNLSKLLEEQEVANEVLKKTQQNIELATENEMTLSKLRTLGQELKRNIDQEVNVFRQASQARRRRFFVYSDPFDIRIAKLPVAVSLSHLKFKIVAGETQRFEIMVTRKYDFKGEIDFQIKSSNGGNGWKLSSNKLKTDQTSLESELVIEKYGKPGLYDGEVVAQMRFGNVSLSKTIPIKVEVLSLEKK